MGGLIDLPGLRGDTVVKICEILIFYQFCAFGIIIKIKLFTSM